jgi:serine/threonine protein phosphatase PrpC
MRLKTITAETHNGPYLELNEDGYDFDLDNNLYLVLDGFGGSGIGDDIVRQLKENLKHFYTRIAADPNSTLPFFYSPKYLIEGNAMINSMLYSHNLLMKNNMAKEISQRGGASGIVLSKADSILTMASVGNCNAYLYRKGVLKKVFIEDSFLFLSNDNYDSHLKTMPLSGFGLFPDLYYQVKEVRLFEGDMVLVMTDGVYARLLEDEVKAILSRPVSNQKLKIKELFDLSNQRGNLDNQTAMILEF